MKGKKTLYFGMLSRFICLMIVAAILAGSVGAAPARAEDDVIMLDCIYGDAGFHRELQWKIPYSDSMFSRTAAQYHHDLARASLGLALSAFRENFTMDPNFIADNHVIDYLLEAGFEDFESTDYDQTPSLQTVSTVIGSKTMEDESGTFTLLAVGICGGGYSLEWLSNFTVGDDFRHVGFNRAAQNVEGRILLYMISRRLTGRIKLWVTGYSRAAAIANIVGADMTDYGPFGMENTFVYTFATPRTTQETTLAQYANIYNIVGKMDPVPMVPMADWGFKRYGNDLYTPAHETDIDFKAKFAKASGIFHQLTGMEMWNNPEVNQRLRTLLSYLLELCPDSEAYTKYLQDALKNMWTNRTIVGMTGNLISLLTNEEMINEENRDEADALVNYIFNLGIDMIAKTGSVRLNWNSAASFIANLGHEHLPSIYLSWMFSSDDPAQIFSDRMLFERIIVQGDTALACLNEQTLEYYAELEEDGTVHYYADETAQGNLPFMARSGGNGIVILPHDARCFILESANKDGSVTVNYVDYDLNTLKVTSGMYISFDQTENSLMILNDGYIRNLPEIREGRDGTPVGFVLQTLHEEQLKVLNMSDYRSQTNVSTRFVEQLDSVNFLRMSRIGLLNAIIITPIFLIALVILIPLIILIRRSQKKKHPERYAKKPRKARKKAVPEATGKEKQG